MDAETSLPTLIAALVLSLTLAGGLVANMLFWDRHRGLRDKVSPLVAAAWIAGALSFVVIIMPVFVLVFLLAHRYASKKGRDPSLYDAAYIRAAIASAVAGLTLISAFMFFVLKL